jgi:hypothetical protein
MIFFGSVLPLSINTNNSDKTPLNESSNSQISNENTNTIVSSNNDLFMGNSNPIRPDFPVKTSLMSSVSEDTVDNNISDIDNSPDIGTESNFQNVQNIIVDNQSLTIQEENTYIDEVNIDSVTSYSGDGESFSFFHTVSGTNRLLVVSIQSEGGKNPKTATYAGQLLTTVIDSGDALPRIVVWSLINPPTGSNSIIIQELIRRIQLMESPQFEVRREVQD